MTKLNNSDRTRFVAVIMSSESEEKKRDAKEIEAAEEEPKVRLFFFVHKCLVLLLVQTNLDPSKLVLTSSNYFLTGPK